MVHKRQKTKFKKNLAKIPEQYPEFPSIIKPTLSHETKTIGIGCATIHNFKKAPQNQLLKKVLSENPNSKVSFTLHQDTQHQFTLLRKKVRSNLLYEKLIKFYSEEVKNIISNPKSLQLLPFSEQDYLITHLSVTLCQFTNYINTCISDLGSRGNDPQRKNHLLSLLQTFENKYDLLKNFNCKLRVDYYEGAIITLWQTID